MNISKQINNINANYKYPIDLQKSRLRILAAHNAYSPRNLQGKLLLYRILNSQEFNILRDLKTHSHKSLVILKLKYPTLRKFEDTRLKLELAENCNFSTLPCENSFHIESKHSSRPDTKSRVQLSRNSH